MDDFDFVKAFAGADLLSVAAVGEVVGRALGAGYKGMVEAGLTETQARGVIRAIVSEIWRLTMESK